MTGGHPFQVLEGRTGSRPGMVGYAYRIRVLTEPILRYWLILITSEPHRSSLNRMHRGQARN